MGQSPEANLVALILLANTETKEVFNRMVSFGNERPCMERVRGRWYKRFNFCGLHTRMGARHLRQAKSFCFLIVRQMWSHGDVVFKHHLKSQQDFGEEDVPPILCLRGSGKCKNCIFVQWYWTGVLELYFPYLSSRGICSSSTICW